MANIKFEECFLKNIEEFISVEDLQEIYERQVGSYENQYYGNFYCPECLIAQLSFHPNAQTPHFRSNGTHDKDCSFNFKPATKKFMENYCNEEMNRDAISRKLKSCLDLLKNQNHALDMTNTKLKSLSTYKKIKYFTIEEGNVKKSIFRKKLSTPFNEDNYNIPIIFYGNVLVEWDMRFENVKYLRIRNIKTNANICSIAISNNIYLHIDDSMKFEGGKKCSIAFLAVMERKGNFNNCRIKYSVMK